MDELGQAIERLAAAGICPADIEKELGMAPFTIHKEHHSDLMRGYAKCGEKLLDEKAENPLRKGKVIRDREFFRAYYRENKERIKEWRRAYYEKNKEKIKAKRAKYLKENAEKVKAARKKYQRLHKDEIALYGAEYRAKHHEKLTAYYKERREKKKQKLA